MDGLDLNLIVLRDLHGKIIYAKAYDTDKTPGSASAQRISGTTLSAATVERRNDFDDYGATRISDLTRTSLQFRRVNSKGLTAELPVGRSRAGGRSIRNQSSSPR